MQVWGLLENRKRAVSLQIYQEKGLRWWCFQINFSKHFRVHFFCSTPPAVTSGRHQSVVFITTLKKRATVLLMSLLLTWNVICYTMIEELHNEYTFFHKKNFERKWKWASTKKISLKNSKTLRNCSENLQPQVFDWQFSKTLYFSIGLFKSYKIE